MLAARVLGTEPPPGSAGLQTAFSLARFAAPPAHGWRARLG